MRVPQKFSDEIISHTRFVAREDLDVSAAGLRDNFGNLTNIDDFPTNTSGNYFFDLIVDFTGNDFMDVGQNSTLDRQFLTVNLDGAGVVSAGDVIDIVHNNHDVDGYMRARVYRNGALISELAGAPKGTLSITNASGGSTAHWAFLPHWSNDDGGSCADIELVFSALYLGSVSGPSELDYYILDLDALIEPETYRTYHEIVVAPDAPTGVVASPGDKKIALSWLAAEGATTHNIYWSTTPGVTTGDNKIIGVSSPYVHLNRENGQPYYYRISGKNLVGEGPLSVEVSAVPRPKAVEDRILAYGRALQNLLPPGPAWPVGEDTTWFAFLEGLSEELVRVETRGLDLLEESLPLTADELLPEWEADYGLPSACNPEPADDDERREILAGTVAGTGGISAPFYFELLASVGVENAVFTEFPPPAGGMEMGDDVGSLVGSGKLFVHEIAIPADEAGVTMMEMGDDIGTPLTTGSEKVACLLNRHKRATRKLVIQFF